MAKTTINNLKFQYKRAKYQKNIDFFKKIALFLLVNCEFLCYNLKHKTVLWACSCSNQASLLSFVFAPLIDARRDFLLCIADGKYYGGILQ